MEFFERLYRGFEAEHYVAGKLFSVGYEAFKLPADFGFDLIKKWGLGLHSSQIAVIYWGVTGKIVRKRTLLSWSSGKDSAWALYVLQQDPTVEVVGLFSVLNERFNRVSMHSTRAELLCQQAEAAGLALHTINLPDPCTNERCDAIMGEFVAEFAAKGTECIAFGDLFLEDVRQYREKQLTGTGIDPLFPLWRVPTVELAEQMLAAGLEAYISSVDLKKLPASFAGRRWSRDLLTELPTGVDPCGENGEIHTIVVGGPMFEKRIEVEVGEIVQRNGFAYADIIPMN